MLFNCGVREDSWESLGLQGDRTSPSKRKSIWNIHWRNWCWGWSSNTLATRCKGLTHLKRHWCEEWVKAGWEGDDREQDVWMTSPIQWTRVWASSGRWWRTGKPGVLLSMGSKRVRHDWGIEQQRVVEIKTKINRWNLIKLKNFYTAKETTKKKKKREDNPQNGRKYLQMM